MTQNLMHQMALDRQADLLREAEEYRRAKLIARRRSRAASPPGSRASPPGAAGGARVASCRRHPAECHS